MCVCVFYIYIIPDTRGQDRKIASSRPAETPREFFPVSFTTNFVCLL